MFNDWRKFNKEFLKTLHDFLPDRSRAVFLFFRSVPTRNNVVRVNLKQGKIRQLFFEMFLSHEPRNL